MFSSHQVQSHFPQNIFQGTLKEPVGGPEEMESKSKKPNIRVERTLSLCPINIWGWGPATRFSAAASPLLPEATPMHGFCKPHSVVTPPNRQFNSAINNAAKIQSHLELAATWRTCKLLVCNPNPQGHQGTQ